MSLMIKIDLDGEVFDVTFSDNLETPEHLVVKDETGVVRGLTVEQLGELTSVHFFLHALKAMGTTNSEASFESGISQLRSSLSGAQRQTEIYKDLFGSALENLEDTSFAGAVLGKIGSAAFDYGVGLVTGGLAGGPAPGLVLGVLGALDEVVEIADLAETRETQLVGYKFALGIADQVLADDATGIASAVDTLRTLSGVDGGTSAVFSIEDLAQLEQTILRVMNGNTTIVGIVNELRKLDAGGLFDYYEDRLGILDEAGLGLIQRFGLDSTLIELRDLKVTIAGATSGAISFAEFVSAVGAFMFDPRSEDLQTLVASQEALLQEQLRDAVIFAPGNSSAFEALARKFPLFATSGNDTVQALADEDITDGQNNEIFGLEGADTINGTGENDVIDGGPGPDVIRPGGGTDRVIFDLGAGDTAAGTLFELNGDTLVNPGGNKLQIEYPGLSGVPALTIANFEVADVGGNKQLLVDVNGDSNADIQVNLESALDIAVTNVSNVAGTGGAEPSPPATIVEFGFPAGFAINQSLNSGLASQGPANLGLIAAGGATSTIGSTRIQDFASAPELRNIAITETGRIFTVLEYDEGEDFSFGFDKLLPPQFPGDAGGVIVELDPETGAFIDSTIHSFSFGTGGTVPNTPPDFGVNSVESINALAPLGGGEFLAIAEFNFRSTNPIRTLEGGSDFAFKINTEGKTEFLVNWSATPLFSDAEGTRTVSADTSPLTGEVFAWSDNVNTFGGGTLLKVDRSTGEPSRVPLAIGGVEITAIAFQPDGQLIGMGGEIVGGVVVPRIYAIDTDAGTVTALTNVSGEFFPEEIDLTGSILPSEEALGSTAGEILEAFADGDAIDAGAGDDTILMKDLLVTATGGPGADRFVIEPGRGSAPTITDFLLEDFLIFLGTTFSRDAISLSFGSLTIDVDTDGDDAIDTSVFLEGDFPADQDVAVTSDGLGNTVLTLVDPNDPPEALDDTAIGLEDEELTISVLENDFDPEGSGLEIVGFTQASNGFVSITPDSTITYTPNSNFVGSDTFQYSIADAAGKIASANVSVTIQSSNDAPIPTIDTAAVLPGETEEVFVLSNDSDPDGDILSLLDVVGATRGSARIEGDRIIYTADGTFTGVDTLTYRVSDGNGGTANGILLIEEDTPALNQPPVVSAITAGFGEDETGRTVNLLDPAFISDPDGDDLNVENVVVTTADGRVLSATTDTDTGLFSMDDGQFEDLADGAPFDVTIDYDVTDGIDGVANTATVTITGANDGPVAEADGGFEFSTDEDTSFTTASVLGNDTDVDGDTLTVSGLDTTGTLGLVTDNGDGTFDYDPNGAFESLGAGDSTTDSFNYTVSDGNGGTDTATVTVNVGGVNDEFISLPDFFSTNEDTALAANGLLLNDGDPDDPDQVKSVTMINGNASAVGTTTTLPSGALLTVLADGTFNYDPNGAFEDLANGESGTDTFSYTAAATPDVVSTTVLSNPNPEVSDVYGNSVAIDGNKAIVAAFRDDLGETNAGVVYIVDVATGTQTRIANPSPSENSQFGWEVDLSGNLAVVGDPLDDTAGPTAGAAYVYDVTNGLLVSTLLNPNPAPPNVSDRFGMDVAIHGDRAVVSAIQGNGISDSYAYLFNSVTGELISSLSPPVSQSSFYGYSVAMSEDYTLVTQFGGRVHVFDTENGNFLRTISVPAHPSLIDSVHSVAIDGDFAVAGGWNGRAYLYDVSTGSLLLTIPHPRPDDARAFGWTIDIADGVIVVGDSREGTTDDQVGVVYAFDANTGDLISQISNPNPSAFDRFSGPATNLTFATGLNAIGVSNGRVIVGSLDDTDGINSGQAYIFHLSGTEDSETTQTSAATVTVIVNGVNDDPVAAGDNDATGENTAVDINVLANDTDVEGDTLTVSAVGAASNGTTAINLDGTIRYTPNAGFDGIDSYSYTVSDGNGGTDTATVSVTVSAAPNQPPDVSAITAGFGEDATGRTVNLLDPAFVSDADGTDLDVENVTVSTGDGRVLSAATNPETGLFSLDDGQFEDLADAVSFDITIDYDVTDGIASVANSATVTINGANDAPVAGADGGVGFSTDEGTAFTTASVLENDTDVDGDTLSVVGLDTTGTLGLVTDNGDGTIDYDPNGAFGDLLEGEIASDTFAYFVSDGVETVRGEVTVTINGGGQPEPETTEMVNIDFLKQRLWPRTAAEISVTEADAVVLAETQSLRRFSKKIDLEDANITITSGGPGVDTVTAIKGGLGVSSRADGSISRGRFDVDRKEILKVSLADEDQIATRLLLDFDSSDGNLRLVFFNGGERVSRDTYSFENGMLELTDLIFDKVKISGTKQDDVRITGIEFDRIEEKDVMMTSTDTFDFL